MPILRKLWQWGQGLPQPDELKNYARVLVAGKDGIVFEEIEPDIQAVAWRLNETSSINLTMSRSDSKATETILSFGNRIIVQFDNGLPDWGGVINFPRTWQPSGAINITAYSGDYILGWRQTEQELIFEDQPAGTIFESLITKANELYDTGIEIGEIYKGGSTFTNQYHFTNILDIIRDQLVDKKYTTSDFSVDASYVNGKVKFIANFYEQKGIDKTNSVQLLEGHNIADIQLVEQGPLINAWDIAGNGSIWSEDRSVSHIESIASIASYDLRQGSEIYTEANELSTVQNIAVSRLVDTSLPRNRLSVKVVDKAPALFNSYDIGDSIQIVLQNFSFGGYDASVRVRAREYDIKGGFCTLVVEEIL